MDSDPDTATQAQVRIIILSVANVAVLLKEKVCQLSCLFSYTHKLVSVMLMLCFCFFIKILIIVIYVVFLINILHKKKLQMLL